MQICFPNIFLFPIGHLTHPLTYHVFLDFWNFVLMTWPLGSVAEDVFVTSYAHQNIVGRTAATIIYSKDGRTLIIGYY